MIFDKIDLINKGIIDGSLNSFNKNTISIGKELAISLQDLIVGDEITLMSTSNLQTPFWKFTSARKIYNFFCL